jgi:hypothetical protein
MSNKNSFPVGGTFKDFQGVWTIVGEPVWSDGCKGYVQDVRDPQGNITAHAVAALRYYGVQA